MNNALNINIDLDLKEKITDIIYNIFLNETNKEDDIYLFFPIIALYFYKKLTNKKFKLKKYIERIKNKLININKNSIEFTDMIIIFKLLMKEINFITSNKIYFNKKSVSITDKIYKTNLKEIIFDHINKKTYKNIKDEVIIYRIGNYIIKKYIFINNYNNYTLIAVIREILLQIYAKIISIKKNLKILIPKIYKITFKKYKNSKTMIKIVMEYVHINRIENSISTNKSLKIFYQISYVLDNLQKYKLYHNDTHRENLIINKKYIILLDFGKSTLYYSFSSSINGFPKINYLHSYNNQLNKYIKKYIKILINKYILKKSNINKIKFLFNNY